MLTSHQTVYSSMCRWERVKANQALNCQQRWIACSQLHLVSRWAARCWFPIYDETVKPGTTGAYSPMPKVLQWALTAAGAYFVEAAILKEQKTAVSACGTLLRELSWQYCRNIWIQFFVSQWAQTAVWQVPIVQMKPSACGICSKKVNTLSNFCYMLWGWTGSHEYF